MAVSGRPFLLNYTLNECDMRTLAFLVTLLLSGAAMAQTTINVDDTAKFTNSIVYLNSSNGVPFVLAKYARIVEGSIFIPESLSPAQVFLKGNAKAYNNVSARLNILDRDLNYYDDVKKMELVASNNIAEVRFMDPLTNSVRVFTKSIPDCIGATPGWHELLEKGKLTLYREIVKTISENKPYGSATTEQRVITSFNYWVQVGEACRKVKSISELTDLILKSDPGFSARLPQRKLSDRKEDDWLEVVRIYNASH